MLSVTVSFYFCLRSRFRLCFCPAPVPVSVLFLFFFQLLSLCLFLSLFLSLCLFLSRFRTAVISISVTISCSSPGLSLHGTIVRRQTKSGWRVPPFILASLFQHVKNREFLTELTMAEGRNTLGASAALIKPDVVKTEKGGIRRITRQCPRKSITSPMFPPNMVSCLHPQQVSWLGFILCPVFPEESS